MDIKKILSLVDHTDLNTTHTWADIQKLCDEAHEFETASVCVAPIFVSRAKRYLDSKRSHVKLCTVVGFPNGYQTKETKCFEAANAVENGADEIDMVVNIGDIKDMRFDLVFKEINKVKESCNGRLLKVIVENCCLTQNEKIKMCQVVSDSNADFIKTSTGFASGGATLEDIILMKKYVYNQTQIKASGGIKTLEDAQSFIDNGAVRLGTSKIVKLAIDLKNVE